VEKPVAVARRHVLDEEAKVLWQPVKGHAGAAAGLGRLERLSSARR